MQFTFDYLLILTDAPGPVEFFIFTKKFNPLAIFINAWPQILHQFHPSFLHWNYMVRPVVKRSVSPFFPPLELHGTACGEM